jgi:hypothetical protein
MSAHRATVTGRRIDGTPVEPPTTPTASLKICSDGLNSKYYFFLGGANLSGIPSALRSEWLQRQEMEFV